MRKILHFDEIDSTNNYLLHYVPAPDEDETVVVTDFQTGGRGQGSNRWESERGKNLLFSVLIHPVWMAPSEQFYLSMAGALALKDVLDEITTGISLKWPNDVYWHDCKLSGTLIETKVGQNRLRDCVFGVGLNVNQQHFRSDAPNPVSLRQIVEHTLPFDELLEKILQRFEYRIQQLRNGDKEGIHAAYCAALYRSGERHLYALPDGRKFYGTLETVEPAGRLCLSVETEQGLERQWFAFKEVQFVI